MSEPQARVTTNGVAYDTGGFSANDTNSPFEIRSGGDTAQEMGVLVGHQRRQAAEDLYISHQATSPNLQTAFALLKEADDNAVAAREKLSRGDVLASDELIYSVKALLPELFCCRDIGEGFGLLVSSITAVFESKGGEQFDATQLEAVATCISTLRKLPFLSAEDADDHVSALEDAGLDTMFSAVEGLFEMASGDDERDTTDT